MDCHAVKNTIRAAFKRHLFACLSNAIGNSPQTFVSASQWSKQQPAHHSPHTPGFELAREQGSRGSGSLTAALPFPHITEKVHVVDLPQE